MRSGLVLVGISLVLNASRAWGHDLGESHPTGSDHVALSDLIAGVALILSIASLWMSARTRRALAERAG